MKKAITRKQISPFSAADLERGSVKRTQLGIVAYDAGNRMQTLDIEGIERTEPVTMAGYVYRSQGTIAHQAVSIAQGGYVDLYDEQGRRNTYVVGRLARQRFGSKAQSVHQHDSLVEGQGKVDCAQVCLFAMLGDESFHIKELRVMHPNPTPEVVEGYKEQLVGAHDALVGGVPVSHQIDSVTVFHEASPAAWYAHEQGILDITTGKVLVVDVGGLTAIIQPVDQFGPDMEARHVFGNGGTKRLAEFIRDALSANNVRDNADLDMILDGLHAGVHSDAEKGQRYVYGSGVGAFCFDAFVSEARLNWAKEILGEYRTKHASHADTWAGTLFVGGGTYQLKGVAETLGGAANGYHVCPQPEYANVRGLLRIGGQGSESFQPAV